MFVRAECSCAHCMKRFAPTAPSALLPTLSSSGVPTCPCHGTWVWVGLYLLACLLLLLLLAPSPVMPVTQRAHFAGRSRISGTV